MKKTSRTSWQPVGKWYNEKVGEEGHYYHQTVILPKVLQLFDFPKDRACSLVDFACGQGVLSRHLPSHVTYTGIDASASLIAAAKRYDSKPSHTFIQADITQKLPLGPRLFSHASIILAIQNIDSPLAFFENAFAHLEKGAPLIIVMNHPCFRIPRQSSWKTDTENKIQYRRIDRYMSSMNIPIQAHPSQGKDSSQTWSFHHPLSFYSQALKKAGFVIELIDEWCSNKRSEGSAAKMENRSREEIPLFMAILARKI